MQAETKQFWAIVELMGHQKIAGHLSEEVLGGTSFIRIDVPATEEQPSFTRLLTDKAIYAINPVTEEVAVSMASSIRSKPIESWDFREMLSRHLKNDGKLIVPADGNMVTIEGIGDVEEENYHFDSGLG